MGLKLYKMQTMPKEKAVVGSTAVPRPCVDSMQNITNWMDSGVAARRAHLLGSVLVCVASTLVPSMCVVKLATAQAVQVQQPAGNNKDCGVCALMSALGTLLRVTRPGNLLSTLDRRWVAAVVLNRDMGPIARLPSLGELPAAVLDALPAPRTPLDVADVPHHVGLPGARMQHALLSMAAANGGMSMLMTVSLQHVQDAMQQQQMHAPQPWEESAKRWLEVESVPPTHTVGMADMGRLVVLEGAEYWACVRVETGGLEWIVVTACRLRNQTNLSQRTMRTVSQRT